MLQYLNELSSLEQRVMRSGIQPGCAPAEVGKGSLTALNIDAIQVSDLQLAARRGTQSPCYIDHIAPVKIKPRDRSHGSRADRLFIDIDQRSAVVHHGNPVTFGIRNPIAEEATSAALANTLSFSSQPTGEIMAKEDVIAKRQATGSPARKSEPITNA